MKKNRKYYNNYFKAILKDIENKKLTFINSDVVSIKYNYANRFTLYYYTSLNEITIINKSKYMILSSYPYKIPKKLKNALLELTYSIPNKDYYKVLI